MVQFFSFFTGVFSTIFIFKTSKILSRVYPYMMKPSFLQRKNPNECIIIAGATDGIGQEYVKRLSKQYKIIAIGRNATKLDSLRKLSENIQTYKIDFNQNVLVDQHLQQTLTNVIKLKQNYKIKGIINSVGIGIFSPFPNLPLSNIIKVNQANIDSLVYLLKILYSLKQKNQLSSQPFFINLSSGVANYPTKFSSAYSGTKAYLSHFMKVVSNEDPSITFLDVKPWFTTTKMVSYINTWDSVMPEEVVDGSLRLLGRKNVGNGTIKHELLEEFRFICLKIIFKRTEQLEKRIQRIKALRNRKDSKKGQ